MSIVDLILWVMDEICSNYCKYPEQYFKKYKDEGEAYEHLVCEKCEKCAINKLC